METIKMAEYSYVQLYGWRPKSMTMAAWAVAQAERRPCLWCTVPLNLTCYL